MVGRMKMRQTWLVVLMMLGSWAIASAALAQGANAMLEGTVKDAKGNAVPGAKVVIKSPESNRTYETKTDKNGKFTQIGIYPSEYEITASAPNLESLPAKMRLPPGEMSKIDLNLNDKAVVAAAAAANTETGKVEAAKREKLGKAFDEGVVASNAGNHDLAIQKFTESLSVSSACYMCYKNIGYSYAQKKEYDKAEEAYKKAIETAPVPDAEAYTGLANVYNAQKKYEQAADALARASAAAPPAAAGGGGGNADALYAQGVNLFNAGKNAEAKAALESAVKANPNLADAWYMLGLTKAGDDPKGAVAAWQQYLKLAPTGKDAATAKAGIDALNK